jgi:3'-phosphoadenosine 5'-phosphosulfate (PAPS) 3'-phosphatase
MMHVTVSLLKEVEVIARVAGATAHEVITRRLERLQPVLPILSAKAVGDFSGADNSGRYWLADPLNGTMAFIPAGRLKVAFCVRDPLMQ